MMEYDYGPVLWVPVPSHWGVAPPLWASVSSYVTEMAWDQVLTRTWFSFISLAYNVLVGNTFWSTFPVMLLPVLWYNSMLVFLRSSIGRFGVLHCGFCLLASPHCFMSPAPCPLSAPWGNGLYLIGFMCFPANLRILEVWVQIRLEAIILPSAVLFSFNYSHEAKKQTQ